MNSISLNNDLAKNDLYPFSLTRPIVDLRVGIFTLREKWKRAGFEVELNPGSSISANIILSKEIIGALKKNNLQWITDSAKKIQHPWDIFRLNAEMIRTDFEDVTQ